MDEKQEKLQNCFKRISALSSHIRDGQSRNRKTGLKNHGRMKELTDGFDKSQVAGISFGGQMHGLVTLDKDDKVIRPAILWNDGRTGEETEYLNEVIGKDKLSEYTANIAFAGFHSTEDTVGEGKRTGEFC